MLLVRICLGPARGRFVGSGGFNFGISNLFEISNLGFRICCLVAAAGRVKSKSKSTRCVRGELAGGWWCGGCRLCYLSGVGECLADGEAVELAVDIDRRAGLVE